MQIQMDKVIPVTQMLTEMEYRTSRYAHTQNVCFIADKQESCVDFNKHSCEANIRECLQMFLVS